MKLLKSITELFCFPGFTAKAKLRDVVGDKYVKVVTFWRQKSHLFASRQSLSGAYDKSSGLVCDFTAVGYGYIRNLCSGEAITRSIKARM
jgi:hypothetical protein